jgi:hypothetical protein
MAHPTKSALFRRLCLALLGGMAAPWSTAAVAQEGALPPPAVPARAASPAGADSRNLLERLGKMEQRLDWLTQQNDALLRENRALTEKAATSFLNLTNHGPEGVASDPQSGTAPAGAAGAGMLGPSAVWSVAPQGTGGQLDGTVGGTERGAAPIGGGRSLSRAAGGDPTAVGQA